MAANRDLDQQASPPVERADRHLSDERTRREERLLDAAAALLVRWGYRKTTIDDVAREAGVGKGTIYLHWKDKNALFRAAILREQQRYVAELQRRIAADPEGGMLHRIVSHGMVAALANPLIAAIVGGRSDIAGAYLGALDDASFQQLVGSGEAYFRELQRAGLLRAELSIPVVSYLVGALKMGLFTDSALNSLERPPVEQLTEALSDLFRRWLEPERIADASEVGKRLLTAYFDAVE